jgi:hypothetical protein
VIYLLSLEDANERSRLVRAAVNGRRWTKRNGRGLVTDRSMVELAQRLNGWTRSVYEFGCAFIHLSSYHDYMSRDPLDALDPAERQQILRHMRCARRSLGKGEGRCRQRPTEAGNLPYGIQRVRAPPGKGRPPARSESCVGGTARAPAKRRQRGRRPRDGASKDEFSLGLFSSHKGAAAPERRNGLARGSGRGRRARHTSKGPTRNLGGPAISAEEDAGEGPG